jgi:hypothetical protein
MEGVGGALYDKDGSHPTAAGTYLAACVFYGALWERTPEGLPSSARLDPEHAAALQRYAWAAVRRFPDSVREWVGAPDPR